MHYLSIFTVLWEDASGQEGARELRRRLQAVIEEGGAEETPQVLLQSLLHEVPRGLVDTARGVGEAVGAGYEGEAL